MSKALRTAQVVGLAGLAVAYAGLAHYSNTVAQTATLGTVLALTPILMAALSLAWHMQNRAAMLALLLLACGGLAFAWPAAQANFSHIYWLEHAGTQSLLCFVFARTLGPGREPLCTYFARLVHGTLPAAIVNYTRGLTLAWALFFGTMALVSTALFHVAPLAVWSGFANFFTGPLIILMFILEYRLRRKLHPHMEHVPILAAVKAYWNNPVHK